MFQYSITKLRYTWCVFDIYFLENLYMIYLDTLIIISVIIVIFNNIIIIIIINIVIKIVENGFCEVQTLNMGISSFNKADGGESVIWIWHPVV